MSQRELNLGILAHVDAGKTTLTERLLHAAGVIGELGSVDRGTTQTDSMALERQRGITIRSAVAAFALDDVHVNLIDTPGHPDFIAEVERVLGVLDGAVLVLSAVEGVQPQTRILMRALERLSVPTLLFINKIDRRGADVGRVIRAVTERLTARIAVMGAVVGAGGPTADFEAFGADHAVFASQLAEVLADNDERYLATFLAADGSLPYRSLTRELARQTAQAVMHPVFLGSAVTGAGIEPLTHAIRDLLPAASGSVDSPPSGLVFKIERGSDGERIAYARMFTGAAKTRDRLRLGEGRSGKVTRLAVFERGSRPAQRPEVRAGEVAQLWGLEQAQIGDRIGVGAMSMGGEFAPPTLEAVVVPGETEDRRRLAAALAELAEQDPLINVRMNELDEEISVSLYGDVQREVIQATLAQDYSIKASFREPSPVLIERIAGGGEALEVLRARTKTNVTGKSSPNSDNPFPATLGLRLGPAPPGCGLEVDVAIDVRLIPMYIYGTVDAFTEHLTGFIAEGLREGLAGWQVPDCRVTIIDCGYRAPGTTSGDFRRLAPLVLMQALARAGTEICEPTLRARIEAPVQATAAIVGSLASRGAALSAQTQAGDLSVIEAVISATGAQAFQRELPGLSNGEGVMEADFAGYRPIRDGRRPTRRRTTPNPLSDEYLMYVRGR